MILNDCLELFQVYGKIALTCGLNVYPTYFLERINESVNMSVVEYLELSLYLCSD